MESDKSSYIGITSSTSFGAGAVTSPVISTIPPPKGRLEANRHAMSQARQQSTGSR
jgi:hypothetical protein